MEGIYVDDEYQCMQLALPSSYDPEGNAHAWDLYGVQRLPPADDQFRTWCATARRAKGGQIFVHFSTARDANGDEPTQKVDVEDKVVTWPDGSRWRKVACSGFQLHLLQRQSVRPHSLTEFFAYLVYALVHHLYTCAYALLPINFFCNSVEVPDAIF